MHPATPMPPNGNMEIVFSFDTTGSMNSCLTTVRQSLQEIMERLFADIPGLKVALFAHGDYCDGNKVDSYVTKYVNFTNNIGELCNFVSNTGGTWGGDADECYELVLHQVRTELNWSPGSQRALVMIGDANPHSTDYSLNKKRIDWKKETRNLKEMGVKIYGVQCGRDNSVEPFYRHISEHTGGRKISLDDISSVVQMLMAVCYREKGPEFFEAFEREVRADREQIARNLSDVFDALREVALEDRAEATVPDDTPPLTPTPEKPSLKRKHDADDATPPTKRRCSSAPCSDSKRTPVHRTGMTTRSRKHPMRLRKRPTIVLPKRI